MVQERNIISWPNVPRFGMYSLMILHHAHSTVTDMHLGQTGYPQTKDYSRRLSHPRLLEFKAQVIA